MSSEGEQTTIIDSPNNFNLSKSFFLKLSNTLDEIFLTFIFNPNFLIAE